MDRSERGFAASADQVRAARLFTDSTLAEWGLEPGDAILVVGELAANAVRHAKSDFTLSLCHTDDTVTVEVTDASPTIAVMASTSWNRMSGRGLMIVDRLARVWGSRPSGNGKTVWAELEAR